MQYLFKEGIQKQKVIDLYLSFNKKDAAIIQAHKMDIRGEVGGTSFLFSRKIRF